MGQLLIRNGEDDLKARLKRQAMRHGRSMEEEARDILRDGLKDVEQPEGGLGTEIAELFRGLGVKKGDIQELRGEEIKNPFEE